MSINTWYVYEVPERGKVSTGNKTNSPSLLALQGGISMKSLHLGGRDRKTASSRPDYIIRLGSYLKIKKL